MRGEDRGEGVQTAADCETPGERPRQDRRGAAGREGLDPARGRGGAASHGPSRLPGTPKPSKAGGGPASLPGLRSNPIPQPRVSHSYLTAKQGLVAGAERC